MDKFLEFIVDKVFSFGMFMFLFAGTAAFLIIRIGTEANANADAYRAKQERLTEACYSQGFVLVDTDAGQRCADPRTLVKVK